MSTLFPADAWARHEPSQSIAAAAADNEKGREVDLANGHGESRGSVQDGKTFAHSAGTKCALVVSDGKKGGAIVAARQPATFSGLYEDVEFPVFTLCAPPHPPSEFPPRVKRPQRPGPVYANDIETAGEREHRAQREVSRMWRGVLCRRRLRQAQTLNEVLNSRARRIQCWWRTLNARWQRRRLEGIREKWAQERRESYISERMANTANMIYWQRHRYDLAAQVIQRMVRWYLREKQRYKCAMEGLPVSEWPPALEQIAFRKHRPYFPWRHAHTIAAVANRPSDADELASNSEEDKPTRTLLQFREHKLPAQPLPQEEVEAANSKMRARRAERALALTTPEALSREEWKKENLRHEDLDFNAGVVQRVYLSKQAVSKVRTKLLRDQYYQKVTHIISRTFNMYVLVKRMHKQRALRERQVRALMAKYNAQKIEALEVEAVWQRELMEACATCIQRCWNWYCFERLGKLTTSAAAKDAVPTPPPYGLIDEHMKRERAMRWSSMNLMERHEFEKARQHLYLRYVPKKTIVCKIPGRFAAASSMKP
ncbi:hypothetical protein JKF63_05772 [Porcisia hertigi]|uniref:Uncharacterized protein n=1 Tax=Porcisia hertigi TaxID=2761500 RepID=A0A836IUU4_9TRYP|nr:hypothetical protein JKF63_05772 [Porcisia hertigi]